MLSLTNGSACYLTSHRPFSCLKYSFISCRVYNPKKMVQACKTPVLCHRAFSFCGAGMDKGVVGGFGRSFCCSCGQKEGDFELESAIIEFMDKSERPTMFPTREELIGAGRRDLVEAIKKIGGWYTLGWSEESLGDNVDDELDFDIREFQRRIGNRKGNHSLGEERDNGLSGGEKENGFSPSLDSNSNSKSLDSLQLGSPSPSSGRLLHRESKAAEDSGIESILNGLEKQRNTDFGFSLGKHGDENHATSEGDYGDFRTPFDAARADHGQRGRSPTGYNNESNKPHEKVNFKPETWRTWSNHRAGIPFSEFEAAEISYGKNSVKHGEETYPEGLNAFARGYSDALDRTEDSSHNEIRTRLQYLEFELSKSLHSLRSNREEISLKEVVGGSVIDAQKLSDEQEFQENEIMSAKERLRSIRANLAILEGKMAMAVNDSQKLMEEKQKQIDGAHRAFQLLRTTHIVWHNSASEVLLTGSFDGWTSQREMEKLETGVFSASLMLYPGRYEIKFIVDGLWKVDPLRPIVNCNGHENNLLIVT